MSAGFLLLVAVLIGVPIGVLLFSIWFNWWIDKQTNMFWPSKGELRLHFIEWGKDQ